jgi:hypothetical protein
LDSLLSESTTLLKPLGCASVGSSTLRTSSTCGTGRVGRAGETRAGGGGGREAQGRGRDKGAHRRESR